MNMTWIWILCPWIWISGTWIWIANLGIHMNMSCMNYFMWDFLYPSPPPPQPTKDKHQIIFIFSHPLTVCLTFSIIISLNFQFWAFRLCYHDFKNYLSLVTEYTNHMKTIIFTLFYFSVIKWVSKLVLHYFSNIFSRIFKFSKYFLLPLFFSFHFISDHKNIVILNMV